MTDRVSPIASEPADWIPTPAVIERANITAAARELGLPDYPALHRWSVKNRGDYWAMVIDRLGIRFRRRPDAIVDLSAPTRPRWFVGAMMNIVESCFPHSGVPECPASDAGSDAFIRARSSPGQTRLFGVPQNRRQEHFGAATTPANDDANAPAIVESDGVGPPRTWSYGQLETLAARVANGLGAMGVLPGDAVGVVIPMSAASVAIYLGIIAAGAAVVSIADSFSADEIATRLRLAGARLVFTQDVAARGSKRLPLYEKVRAAAAPQAVVVSLDANNPAWLRDGDLAFANFLSDDDTLTPVVREPMDPINILFSSGTTGEPKAIPWDHTTPIKAAADAHFHQDIHPGDVVCWPTSLGWMMGPWLIFAALINRATIAIYAQTPTDRSFGNFVQDAGVTLLGLVPSLVRAWRQSGCMHGLDWSKINAFSSTGECSNPDDMRYLMSLAGGRPVIEYCGGTEIGGAYVTATIVQPCIPSTFTTPALGLDFVLLDEEREPAEKGEVFIEGPSIGLSTRLLNRDHDAIYFTDTPKAKSGIPLRRHGDELEKLPGGCYRVAGRSDDTMNLGGIKVGCAEIERVLNPLPGVQETAAVAIAPPGGGPSRLVIFVVRAAGNSTSADAFKPAFQQAIRTHLNPLFHVEEVRLIASLPRTASNKVMRRELRKLMK